MKIVLTTLNAKYVHSALALYSLKSSLKAQGILSEIKEYSINQHLSDLVGDLFRQNPDVLALACYIWNRQEILQLSQAIKAILPKCKIIIGGPEATYNAASLLQNAPWVDYVILGEGEETLPALLKALRNDDEGIARIKGIAWRSPEGIVAGEAQVVNELDSLPFPYEETDLEQLTGKILYYETSRGCPYSCQYCLSSATQGVRFRSFDKVKAELDVFLRRQVRQVKLVDRTFNAKPEHYQSIWRYLAQAEAETLFHFEVSADILQQTDLELLTALPSGRFQLEIGVQSTNEKTLRQIQRINQWERLTDNVNCLRKADNVHLHLDLIAGLPYEDYASFANSFNEVYALKPHMLQLGFLKLLPGSGIRREAEKHEYVFLDIPPYEVMGNRWLHYAELLKLKEVEDVVERFYNSGLFAHSVDYLVRQTQGGAFVFYERLAEYWAGQGFQMIAHSSKGLAEILLRFAREEYAMAMELFEELLKLDMLLVPKGGLRISGLSWDGEQWDEEKTAFWRDEERVRQYLPNYTFLSWRELKKRYQMEQMSFDVLQYLASGTINRLSQTILIDYSGKRVQLHAVSEMEQESVR
ncbi:B12-binding domain-containing radical SAM protein [Azotosporobacter soli]|uniref:B12-binding domain-containing radical SAM protein n=1 Tax=Azotosporobacter soli TaxID=3055040 RepID=UPI0031FE53D4